MDSKQKSGKLKKQKADEAKRAVAARPKLRRVSIESQEGNTSDAWRISQLLRSAQARRKEREEAGAFSGLDLRCRGTQPQEDPPQVPPWKPE